MGWKDTIQPDKSSWRDTIEKEKSKEGILNTALTQSAAGATAGFDDELGGGLEAVGKALGVQGLGGKVKDVGMDAEGPTLDVDKLKQAYTQRRDTIRQMKADQQAQHPVLSTASQIGGTLLNPAMSGEASLAKMIGLGAAQGLGDSTSENLSGMAKDTALGGAIGFGAGAASKYVLAPALKKAGQLADSGIQSLNNTFSPYANKAAAKTASVLTGVDKDAALRMATRPAETALAEADDFAFKTGQRAVSEADALGSELGQNVGNAKAQFLKTDAATSFPEGKQLAYQVGDFLEANKPSPKGFSAISKPQRAELEDIALRLDSGDMVGEDLLKIRDHIDHVEKVASKYDEKGSSPYVRFLKSLRHNADQMLDSWNPGIDKANQAFSQYTNDMGMLSGVSNEARSESMISNLYGANKKMQQEAAGRLFSPDTMNAAQDVAANKAFEFAKRPGGDNYFRRAALAVLTKGASEAATSASIAKRGLRFMGTVEQAIKNNPQALGQFSGVLSQAAQRGPQALAATHFILSQQNQQYRESIEKLDKDGANE